MKDSLNQSKTAPNKRGFWSLWWPLSVFWLLIALASVLEARVFRSAEMSEAVRSAALQWLPWALVSPVIIWLSSAFTLERSTWLRNIWIHLLACIVIVGGLGAVAYFEGPQPPFPGGGGPQQFPHGGPQPFDQEGDHHPPHRDGDFFPDRDSGHPGPGGPHRGPPPRGLRLLRSSTFQLPTYLAMLGVAHALLFYQRSKDRERRGAELESRLTQARLQTLRTQLNPHFLFNTLNSIASLVYDQPRVADDMISSLSDLLRLTLSASDRQEVTLREDLHFLDQYLFIEQTRFGERLRVEKDIEPAALDAIVPILILQPLAENVVKHGIEAQLTPVVIRIEVKRQGDRLLLRVIDNGRGKAKGANDAGLKEGVGLSNSRARLRELYGERGTLHYEFRETGGFMVEIQLPWRTATTSQPNNAA